MKTILRKLTYFLNMRSRVLLLLLFGLSPYRSEAAMPPFVGEDGGVVFRVVWRFQEGEPCESIGSKLPGIFLGIDLVKPPSAVFARPVGDDVVINWKADPENNLSSYCHAYVATAEDAGKLLAQLEKSDKVAGAPQAEILPRVPEPEPEPERMPETEPGLEFEPMIKLAEAAQSKCKRNEDTGIPTPSFRHCQGYLDEASLDQELFNIDAEVAWEVEGGCGRNIILADFEKGWSTHEDLPEKPEILGQFERSFHGAAVLGICAASHDARGIHGIAPDLQVRLVPFNAFKPLDFPNLGPIIIREAKEIARRGGGVILLELHTMVLLRSGSELSMPVPVEVSPDVRAAIASATNLGIYVVAAAGNGGQDLNTLELIGGPIKEGPSILVGAGNPKTLMLTPSTNRGDRVDVGAWGLGIATAGGFNPKDNSFCTLQCRIDKSHECYTKSFNGTSGAAAMVAGMVASLAGIAKAHRLEVSQERMRSILRSSTLVWRESGIGHMPNLKQALQELAKDLPVGESFKGIKLREFGDGVRGCPKAKNGNVLPAEAGRETGNNF